jgi:membrane fusion protein (multidrug efflux system)
LARASEPISQVFRAISLEEFDAAKAAAKSTAAAVSVARAQLTVARAARDAEKAEMAIAKTALREATLALG